MMNQQNTIFAIRQTFFLLALFITGNIVLGNGPKDGATKGRGLEDFAKLTWDAIEHNATPTADAPFDKADPRFLLDTDFNGRARTNALSGAVVR